MQNFPAINAVPMCPSVAL